MKRLPLQTIVASAALVVGASCATYSKKECEAFDWDSEGYSYALSGGGRRGGIDHFRKHCQGEHDVAPDFTAFGKGYDKGIGQFCSTRAALEFGATGGDYKGTCPREKETEFFMGFYPGRVKFLESRVQELETENRSLEWDVSQLRSEVSSLESEVSSLESEVQ
jgi:hypothetical protein